MYSALQIEQLREFGVQVYIPRALWLKQRKVAEPAAAKNFSASAVRDAQATSSSVNQPPSLARNDVTATRNDTGPSANPQAMVQSAWEALGSGAERSRPTPGASQQASPESSSTAPAARARVRAPSAEAELVVPASELKRFTGSKIALHLGLALLGRAIPVVENAVQSDTAIWFEGPVDANKSNSVKLGALSLLRTSARARRSAWLAIRLWRKQQR